MTSGGSGEYFPSTVAIAVEAYGGCNQKKRTLAAWPLILGMLDDETDSWFLGLNKDGAPRFQQARRVPSARLCAFFDVGKHAPPATSS